MGRITVACGATRSERAAYIDAVWHEQGERAILLTPTRRVARARQEAFVRRHGLPGVYGDQAWELTDFARVLVEQTQRGVRMVSMLERRLMTRLALETVLNEKNAPALDMTPGLVRHLLGVITQLKQAAIEPKTFRAAVSRQKRRADTFDGLVARVYEGYQAALIESARYDVPGLYWEAERLCRADMVRLPNNPHTILADGFDDFTLSQQRFLGALSDHVAHLIIGLNYDAGPDRLDLYHLQQRWLEAFKADMDIEVLTFESAPPETYVHFIDRHLFWRDTPPSPAGLCANLEVVPCADEQHEFETFGRRIKQLIVHDHVAPQDIAVCAADIEQAGEALYAVFARFGIPVVMGVAPTLLNTKTGAFVMRLYEAMERWERTTVVTLLASPLLGGDEQVMAFPLLARRAGIVMGRDAWERYFQDTPANEAALELFRERFRILTKLADTTPDEADAAIFAGELDAHLTAFDIDSGVTRLADADTAQFETAAVRALRSLLEQLARTAPGASMSRTAFARLLGEAMDETRLSARRHSGPGVYCCGFDGLRHAHFDHVFIGGLNEGLLPRPAPVNAVYAESDLRRLRALGLSLPGQREHTYRERLLFCHGINAAQKTLTLAWRKQDHSGRDSLPSPFVVEITDLFASHGIDVMHTEPGPDAFVPAPEEAASARDLANALYYRGDPELCRMFPERTGPVARVVNIETERNSTKPFGKYDGCLNAPDLVAKLAARYGNDAQFSVNQLEMYLEFPFHFFMSRVLGITETALPEAELDARARGAIAHDALYLFHKRFADTDVETLLTSAPDDTRTAMRDCVEAAFHRNARHLASVPKAMVRVEQRRLEQALDRYLNRAANDFGDLMTPCYFEATFGRAPRDAEEDLYKEAPFPLTIDNETFLLTGKIDRIDANEDTVRVVDYKSGGTPGKKAVREGTALQLTVYAWAVEQHLLPGTECREAYYYSVYKTDKREALLRKNEEEFQEREVNAKARIAQAIHGIRTGQFPPVPDASLSLEFVSLHTAARYEAWRVERKCDEPNDS